MNSILDKALDYYLLMNGLEFIASVVIFILIVYYIKHRK